MPIFIQASYSLPLSVQKSPDARTERKNAKENVNRSPQELLFGLEGTNVPAADRLKLTERGNDLLGDL